MGLSIDIGWEWILKGGEIQMWKLWMGYICFTQQRRISSCEKKLVNTHICSRNFNGSMVIAKWITTTWLEKFRRDPNMNLMDIMEWIKEKSQVDIPFYKAFKLGRLQREYRKEGWGIVWIN